MANVAVAMHHYGLITIAECHAMDKINALIYIHISLVVMSWNAAEDFHVALQYESR